MKYIVICLSLLAVFVFYQSTRMLHIPGPVRQDRAVEDLEKLNSALELYLEKYENTLNIENVLQTLKQKGLVSDVTFDPWGQDYIFNLFKRKRITGKVIRTVGVVVILISPFIALFFYMGQLMRRHR